MKFIIFIISILTLANASNLEITSNNFFYKDGEAKAKFSGNVVAKEGQSLIKASTLTVFLDKNSEAKKYEATGNVQFEIKNSKKDIKGKCAVLIYLPIQDRYILQGNVELDDLLNKRKVYGDEIILDNKKGESYAKSSSKKPVKFIFKVKSKK